MSETDRLSCSADTSTSSSIRSAGAGCSTLTRGATDTGTRSTVLTGRDCRAAIYFDIAENIQIRKQFSNVARRICRWPGGVQR